MPPRVDTTKVKPIHRTPSEAAIILLTIAAFASSNGSFLRGLTISVRITAESEFRPELTVL